MPRHGFSPELAASGTIPGAVGILSPVICQRKSAKSPALRARIKHCLLPAKQARILWAHRPDLAMGYLEATQLDEATGQPRDGPAFQEAVDGTARLITLKHWIDPQDAALSQWKRQRGIGA